MKSIILLYIGGNMFFFEGIAISSTQKEELESLAFYATESMSRAERKSESQICSWFIDAAKEKLGINLQEISISLIIRPNRKGCV